MALPSTRYNFKGAKKETAEIVSSIGKAIFSQARVSFEAASKAVVPDIASMVSEITDDLSAGPLDRFSDGLKKVDKLVNELGVDIGKYSKELGEFLQRRQEKSIVSEETVNQLRLLDMYEEFEKCESGGEHCKKAWIVPGSLNSWFHEFLNVIDKHRFQVCYYILLVKISLKAL